MSAPTESPADQRHLVVVVGPDGKERVDLARGLLDEGSAVVLCSGPPGCVLLRDDTCPLLNAADGVVVMPTGSHAREVVAGLSLCAARARNALVLEPSTVDRHARAVRAQPEDPADAADLMTSMLDHPSARRARR